MYIFSKSEVVLPFIKCCIVAQQHINLSYENENLFILCCFQLCSTTFPPSFLVSTLPATAGQTSLHVFNHEPTGQAERGKTFYIFNVVQPTEADDIFSHGVPNIAVRNRREIYFIYNVEVTDVGSLVVQYFEVVGEYDAVSLGSLTTNISVIGEPKLFEWYGSDTYVALPGRMLAVLDKTI